MDGALEFASPVDLVEVIAGRQAFKLAEPAPSAEALERAFAAALTAPDHKRLRPWRFFVIPREWREAFGDVLGRCLLAAIPDAPDSVLQKERGKAVRAPMVVICAAKITPDMGVPEIEQVLSAGAATQNFLLALHAQGYAGAWKTGGAAYSPVLKEALGLDPSDHIVGILYVGTQEGPLPPRPASTVAEFVSEWRGA